MNSSAYRMTREELSGTGNHLSSFYFGQGGNIYVFSYLRKGVRRHTLIDAGDSSYTNQILSIMLDNEIQPAAIERIIITHGHPDHCGLAYLLAKESGAEILVHSNFKNFVEGQLSNFHRYWMGSFDPAKLAECHIEYLPTSEGRSTVDIGAVAFPSLMNPIEIGDAGKLMILACPKSVITHSDDQIIVLYSTRDYLNTDARRHNGYRPTDDILFSGDLWLMTGPIFERRRRSFHFFFRRSLYRIGRLITSKGMRGGSVMEQDSLVKEALKRNFSLIRVKPGHGEEFIGSRIVPIGLLADRDLLRELGYSTTTRRSILKSADLAPKVASLNEKAFRSFVQEVRYWKEQGYDSSEISELLVRIYREQTGGSRSVALDRNQRRVRMKATLSKLKGEKTAPGELCQLAELTLKRLDGVS